MHIAIYLALCLVAALFGSRRLLGFWGFLLLSVVATPLLSFAVLVLGASRKRAKA